MRRVGGGDISSTFSVIRGCSPNSSGGGARCAIVSHVAHGHAAWRSGGRQLLPAAVPQIGHAAHIHIAAAARISSRSSPQVSLTARPMEEATALSQPPRVNRTALTAHAHAKAVKPGQQSHQPLRHATDQSGRSPDCRRSSRNTQPRHARSRGAVRGRQQPAAAAAAAHVQSVEAARPIVAATVIIAFQAVALCICSRVAAGVVAAARTGCSGSLLVSQAARPTVAVMALIRLRVGHVARANAQQRASSQPGRSSSSGGAHRATDQSRRARLHGSRRGRSCGMQPLISAARLRRIQPLDQRQQRWHSLGCVAFVHSAGSVLAAALITLCLCTVRSPLERRGDGGGSSYHQLACIHFYMPLARRRWRRSTARRRIEAAAAAHIASTLAISRSAPSLHSRHRRHRHASITTISPTRRRSASRRQRPHTAAAYLPPVS
jgi:hypothetical protein